METPAEPEYMVSYQYAQTNASGNFTGTLKQVQDYAADSLPLWKSHSFFLCVPPQGFQIIKELLPCNENGELIPPHIPDAKENL